MKLAIGTLVVFFSALSATLAVEPPACNVLVYGGTPAGIAAAVAAADDGERVVLVEPTRQIGGMLTSGLSHADFHAFEGLTGAYREFAARVEQYYAKKYGPDSPQVRDSFHGTFAEPHVNLAVFQQLIAERPTLQVITGARLEGVSLSEVAGGKAIESATFLSAEQKPWTIAAAVFIDVTYEGDLMAAAGVPFRVGREGRDEFGESLAPPTSDNQLQAYNFRLCMTREPNNRVAPKAPAGYRRDDFLPVLKLLEGQQIKTVFGYPSGCIFKAQQPPLPNQKYDINDVSRGLIRLSLPGANLGWPNGTVDERESIFAEHLRDQMGLLYFLQNDEAVPAKFRAEASQWGLCKDEFVDNEHLPPQLYVREARRMTGKHIYTQRDNEPVDNEARAKLHVDSIAIGEYGNNCHGTAHEGPRIGGKHTGEFYNPVPPYQIPYGVLLPKDVKNLLVPGAMSATHVGFCALRLEPIWMSLGQAAGHAAHLARENKYSVREVSVGKLQRRLHRAGAATVYVGDVPHDDPDFVVVQAFGTAGALHGLFEKPPTGPRGKNITGQYYEGYPNHTADLDRLLEPQLVMRWTKIARSLDILPEKLPAAGEKITRRAWLQAAAKHLK